MDGEGTDVLGSIGVMSGIPHLHTAFVGGWFEMQVHNRTSIESDGKTIKTVWAGGSEHAEARNNLAEAMEGDWLLYLDTDMIHPRDTCEQLLKLMYLGSQDGEPTHPVVTGVYWYHQHVHGQPNPNVSPVLGSFSESMNGARHNLDYMKMLENGIKPNQAFPVDWCGGGCLMVHRSVFERIAETGEKPFDNVMTPVTRFGEDISFCWRLKHLGIPIWVNPLVQCAHLDVVAVSIDTFLGPGGWQKLVTG